MSEEINQKLAELRLHAIIEEYKALRNELIQKFQHQLQIYSITVTAVVAVMGFSFAQKNLDILLVLPLISSAFAFRYIWEQSIIVKIADYLRMIESQIMPKLTGLRSTKQNALDTEKYWVGWEHYYQWTMKQSHSLLYYKWTIELLFVGPILMALFVSLAVVIQVSDVPLMINSFLPLQIHLLLIAINLLLAVYIFMKLYK